MKNKYLLIIVIFICLIGNVYAQSPDWLWAKKIGGTSFSHDSGGSITTDAAGNTYTAGFFGGTVDFDPGVGVYNLTAINPNDNFILKLDSSGNFLWAKKLSTFNYENIHCIVTDASGNVYTTGFFSGMVDFDPGAGVFNLTAAGPSDIYIWKLDASGNLIWAKAMGGTSNESGYALVIDSFGNICIGGSFWGTVDFDPGPGIFNLTAVGNDDIFISKLDSAGSFIWAKAIGGPDHAYCYGITVNPSASADIYITGSFTGTSDFDPGTGVFNLTSNGNNDIYICKLDSAGNFLWAKAIGSSTNNDFGFSIAVDPSGNGDVYTKGSFQGTVDFDPGVGVFNLTGAGLSGFISKLNSAGNFTMAIALGGGSSQGRSLALDASGNVYASGAFTGTTDFDPGPGIFNLTSAGSGDVYISKYDSAGNFAWVKTAGGSSNDISIALAHDASGNVFVTGSFLSPILTFSPFSITNSGSAIYSDLFIAKLESTLITGSNELSEFRNNVLVFPNPFTDELTIANQYQNTATTFLSIKNTLGQTVESKKFSSHQNQLKIDLEFLSKGIYFLEINVGEERMVTKILKQ